MNPLFLYAELFAETPPAALRDRLLSAVARDHAALLLHPAELPWSPTPYPGVDTKPLALDESSGFVTRLVRMAPGSRIPAHRHSHREQCYVLSGDLLLGVHELHAGAFSSAFEIPEVQTRDGNLLLIIGVPS